MIALSDLRTASTSALSRSAEGSGAAEGSDLVEAHSLTQLSSHDMTYDDSASEASSTWSRPRPGSPYLRPP